MIRSQKTCLNDYETSASEVLMRILWEAGITPGRDIDPGFFCPSDVMVEREGGKACSFTGGSGKS
jgi:hypothetical protein